MTIAKRTKTTAAAARVTHFDRDLRLLMFASFNAIFRTSLRRITILPCANSSTSICWFQNCFPNQTCFRFASNLSLSFSLTLSIPPVSFYSHPHKHFRIYLWLSSLYHSRLIPHRLLFPEPSLPSRTGGRPPITARRPAYPASDPSHSPHSLLFASARCRAASECRRSCTSSSSMPSTCWWSSRSRS